MKTHNVKPKELKREWLLFDAEGIAVGRLASEISRVLRGKHKANFVPHLDCGDSVIVVNAEKVKLTGNKWNNKIYYHHTNYIGGIKSASAARLRATYPERILETAVKGMLPKNKLSRQQMKHLKIYRGAEHPHTAQNPRPADPRTKGKA